MAQATQTKLLPAEGRKQVPVTTAFQQWLGLVLMDFEPEGELVQFANRLVEEATSGGQITDEALGGLARLAQYTWGRGAPRGFGDGPNTNLSKAEGRVTLMWDGTFTPGRQICWTFTIGDAVVEAWWTSGTGKESRFISLVFQEK